MKIISKKCNSFIEAEKFLIKKTSYFYRPKCNQDKKPIKMRAMTAGIFKYAPEFALDL